MPAIRNTPWGLPLLVVLALSWASASRADDHAKPVAEPPASPAASAPAATPDEQAASAIQAAFAERYPKVSVKSVLPSHIPGLYEVLAGNQILYADARGDFLLMGPLVDTRLRLNITQQRLAELTAVKFDSLPLDKAITLVKGKGERHIAVFSDPECPYCKRLEKELAGMDNLTVHLFLMPLAQLHPGAPALARDIWCSADPAASWRAYMLDGRKPEAAPAKEGDKPCQDPIQAIAALADEMGISGTPAIILPTGRRVDGFLPADKLEAALAKGS